MHPFTFGDEPANAGDTVAVQCIVTKGDSPVNITWLLNGKPTTEIEGITVTKIGHKSSSISIDSVASVHTGVYTCLAVNRAGHVNFSTELAVNGIYYMLDSYVILHLLYFLICFKEPFKIIPVAIIPILKVNEKILTANKFCSNK